MTWNFARTVAIGLTALLPLSVTAKEAFPSKPVTVIVSWKAGGATDLVARAIQPGLERELGADVVIRNVAGAAGTIGAAEAANADPDGYTIFVTPSGVLTTQPALRPLPYDIDSFRAIGRAVVTPLVTMVRPDSEYNSIEDLMDAVRAKPGSVTMASSGAGTMPHLAILALQNEADVSIKHVPYNGSAEAVKAVLGSEVVAYPEMANLAEKYQMKTLSVWSAERVPYLPDVPTMRESGYDVAVQNWLGYFAPANTSDEVVAKLATALEAALQDPQIAESIEKLDVRIGYLGPEDFDVSAREDAEAVKTLIKRAGLLSN